MMAWVGLGVAAALAGIAVTGWYIERPGPGEHAAMRGEAAVSNRRELLAGLAGGWKQACRLAGKARWLPALAHDWRIRVRMRRHVRAALRQPAQPVAYLVPLPPHERVLAAPVISACAPAPLDVRQGLWYSGGLPPGPRDWMPRTMPLPARPDVEDLADTGVLPALVDWATRAPLRELT